MDIAESLKWIRESIEEKLGLSSSDDDTPDASVMAGAEAPSIAKARHLLTNHPLQRLLPYEQYDNTTELFFNTDSFGFLLEATPLSGANLTTMRMLNGLFDAGLPPGSTIQISLWASPRCQNYLRKWQSARLGGIIEDAHLPEAERNARNIYQKLAERRVAFLQNGAERSLSTDIPMPVRDFQLYISVLFPGKPSGNEYRAVLGQRQAIRAILDAAGIPNRVMNADELISLMDEILNPGPGVREPMAWNEHARLADQMVDGDTNFLVGKRGLTVRQTSVRTFSPRAYPREGYLTTMAELVGDSFQEFLQIPCPFLFSMGIEILDQEAIKQMVDIKATRATTNATSPMARFQPDLQEKMHDWKAAQTAISAGQGLCRVSHHLTLFAPLGTGDSVEQTVRSIFRAQSWALRPDTFCQLPSFLASLPLSYSKKLAGELKVFGRTWTLPQWNAVALMPVVGEWKGNGGASLMLLGRKGQVCLFDIFAKTEGNYNVAVAARSGVGKSVLFQESAVANTATGGRTWIIDKGRSYEKVIKLLGGQFIEFSPSARLCINPFTNVIDFQEEMSQLKSIVGQAARPSGGLTDEERNFIGIALQRAWDEEKNSMTFTSIAKRLAAHDDPRAKDLARLLTPYTADGDYARFFEGPSTLEFTSPLVGLELDDLSFKKDLQGVVLLIVMLQIQAACYQSGDRTTRKICIIDEAWSLFAMEGDAARFIEEGYRVIRKHGGAYLAATQSIGDYYKYAAATAAIENSDWMLLLAMRDESLEQMSRSGRLIMDEYKRRLFKSLTTRGGTYSEIAICGTDGVAVERLVVDPYSINLYSTTPADFQAVQNLLRQGVSVEEALDRIVQWKTVNKLRLSA